MTRYRDMMRTMLNEVWDDDTILAELARMEALIGQHVVGQDAESHAENVNDVRVFLQNRKRDLLNAVNADPIPFTGQLLESPVCLQYSGDLNASFRGRWDTLGMENPLQVRGRLPRDMAPLISFPRLWGSRLARLVHRGN